MGLKFTKALVRKPGKSIIRGLTGANLGVPDYQKALQQHTFYVDALKKCGLEVSEMDADENFPDSTFIEDTALLTANCAIITNPGAISRRGETVAVKEILPQFYTNIDFITSPATIEAGDILMAGDHFYIGLSKRTNLQGAQQLLDILNKYGYTGSTVPLQNVLHLKTGISYLENNILLAAGEFIDNAELQRFDIITVDDDESYAANSLWINGAILVPEGFPKTRDKIKARGYKIIELNMSEFQKVDGGLSCLSLRF